MRKLYVIFGGAGFIGKNLLLHKTKLDSVNQYVVIDNFCTSLISEFNELFDDTENVRLIQSNIQAFNISHIHRELDICDQIIVYNLACPASPPKYLESPIFTLDTCFNGVKNIYEQFLSIKDRVKILYASTSEVYGDPIHHPQVEYDFGNVNSFGSRACYDEGKRVAESLSFEFIKKGLDIRIARIFNTYGPHMSINDGRVITSFIQKCLAKEALIIQGVGLQTRSFCYIDDMVVGLELLAESPSKKHLNAPFNIGNPEEYSIIDIAKKITSLMNIEYNVEYRDLPQNDPQKRNPSIEKMKFYFNWSPNTSFDCGLKKTLKYFLNNIIE